MPFSTPSPLVGIGTTVVAPSRAGDAPPLVVVAAPPFRCGSTLLYILLPVRPPGDNSYPDDLCPLFSGLGLRAVLVIVPLAELREALYTLFIILK